MSFNRLCGHAGWCIAQQRGAQLLATKPCFGAEETDQGVPRAGRVGIQPVVRPEAQGCILREKAGRDDARSLEELADLPSHLVAQAPVHELRKMGRAGPPADLFRQEAGLPQDELGPTAAKQQPSWKVA